MCLRQWEPAREPITSISKFSPSPDRDGRQAGSLARTPFIIRTLYDSPVGVDNSVVFSVSVDTLEHFYHPRKTPATILINVEDTVPSEISRVQRDQSLRMDSREAPGESDPPIRGRKGSVFNGDRDSVWESGESWGRVEGTVHNSVNVTDTPELCT